jgi:hypothetical protein
MTAKSRWREDANSFELVAVADASSAVTISEAAAGRSTGRFDKHLITSAATPAGTAGAIW